MKLVSLILLLSVSGLASAAGNENPSANNKTNSADTANKTARNLVIVTIDGLRWQEVFRGADAELMQHKDFNKSPEHTTANFGHSETTQRRQTLLPFLWQTVNKQGMLIGNRDNGSYMSVANNWYFSYPGYSEIFTGVADDRINSNKKIPNPNISFMEYLNNRPGFNSNLAVFAGWDVFPAIFNTDRSNLHVNAGFMDEEPAHSNHIKLLNKLQHEVPKIWHNVRLDTFTYRFAKDYLMHKQPRVLAIAFGETDDFAHDGHYDQYLMAAQRTDQFIADLWQTIQSLPQYKDNTNLLITTDHGRGEGPLQWQHHASKQAILGYMKNLDTFPQGIVGSEHIWFAAMGPDIASKGEVKTPQEIKQNQIAATALRLLGQDPTEFNSQAAPAISLVLEK